LSKARVTQKLDARIMMPATTRLIQKLFILGTQVGVQASPSALKSARACTLSAADRGGCNRGGRRRFTIVLSLYVS
jgi:hypothetical protein